MYTYIYTYISIYIYIYIHTHTHVYIHIYIYIRYLSEQVGRLFHEGGSSQGCVVPGWGRPGRGLDQGRPHSVAGPFPAKR